jgi:hypothetical protein
LRADNTKHLLAAARQRSDDARRRAENALEQLIADREPVTVAGLARAGRVSRSWLYTQPDLLDQIQRRASDKTAISTVATRTSDASLQRRLELAPPTHQPASRRDPHPPRSTRPSPWRPPCRQNLRENCNLRDHSKEASARPRSGAPEPPSALAARTSCIKLQRSGLDPDSGLCPRDGCLTLRRSAPPADPRPGRCWGVAAPN